MKKTSKNKAKISNIHNYHSKNILIHSNTSIPILLLKIAIAHLDADNK